MNLPVRDLAAALPFYETVLRFQVVSRLTAFATGLVSGKRVVMQSDNRSETNLIGRVAR